MSHTNNKEVEKATDIAIANLIFSGLSIARIDKIPKWLLENFEKNKTDFKATLHQELQKAREIEDLYNELLHAVESKFDGETRYQTALRYIQQAEQKPLEAYQSELDQPTTPEVTDDTK